MKHILSGFRFASYGIGQQPKNGMDIKMKSSPITKKCPQCKRVLFLNSQNFHRHKTGAYGFKSACKKCRRKEARKWVGQPSYFLSLERKKLQRISNNINTLLKNNPVKCKNGHFLSVKYLGEDCPLCKQKIAT